MIARKRRVKPGSGASVPRIGYLVAQLPALNHHYLVEEVRYLRESGLEVLLASISPADRPPEDLRADERALSSELYCVKDEHRLLVLWALIWELLRRPRRFWRAFREARMFALGQKRPSRYALFYLAEAILVVRWMVREEIIHLHASFSATIALLANSLSGCTISFGAYGFGELYDPVGTGLGIKIRRSLFVRSVSRHGVGQMMLACAPEDWPKLKHIPLGITVGTGKRKMAKGREVFEVLCVGRLSPEKGHRLILAALSEITRQVPPLKLKMRFIGDGPDRAFLEADAAERGLSEVVEFEGWVTQDRLDEAYRAADAFVLASLYEGIPIVLMEAMALGIPCIAPAINGIPELIISGRSGFLFSPGDFEELAAHLRQVLSSAALADEIGTCGKERVLQSFDLEKNSRLLAEEFRCLLVDQ